MRHRLLVVANRTVDAPKLLDELRRRAREHPTELTILIPAAWSEREQAAMRAQQAVESLREDALEVDVILGDADPACAVEEAWDPRHYDEILVATLPRSSSRWLEFDLPHRIARTTDARVEHIEVPPAPPPPEHVDSHARLRDPFLVRLLGSLRISTRSG
jgi:hypothetical protein